MERKRIGYLVVFAVVALLAAVLWRGVAAESLHGQADTSLRTDTDMQKAMPLTAETEPLLLYQPLLPLESPLPEEPASEELTADTEEPAAERTEKGAEKTAEDTLENAPEETTAPAADELSGQTESAAEPAEEPEEETVYASTGGDWVERMLELVNNHRAQNGMSALALDSTLCSAAATRASECTRYFSHTRPDGSQWYTVSSLAHGENLVMGTDMGADTATMELMNSAGHRANILDSRYATIGIGYCYSGADIYWVQLFGY